MELIEIYNNGDMKVELLKAAANQLNERAFVYKLDSITIEELLKVTCEYLEVTSGEITIPEKASIIHRNDKRLGLKREYEPLCEAFFLLTDSFDLTTGELTKDWKMKIAILVSLYYSLQGLGTAKILFLEDGHFEKITGVITYQYSSSENILFIPFILDDKENFQRLC